MKGIETKFLLGLILLVVIILILFIIVFNPFGIFVVNSGSLVSFREFCIFWSMRDYTDYPTVEISGKEIKVDDQCGFALGKADLTGNDIENCKNMCRAKS